MKKSFLIPVLFLLLALIATLSLNLSAEREEQKAMAGVIRLHVRAADDSAEEQALKLQVRDGILKKTTELLVGCKTKEEAAEQIRGNLALLEEAGLEAVTDAGKTHAVSVSLGREKFEYREYDGFFLPEGEYDSLIINIGEGAGKNWWCVVFPAACYMGVAELETDAEQMPACFRLANKRAEDVTVKFWLWEKIKDIFS